MFPKSKFMFACMLIFLILLAGFCIQNADTEIYRQRYVYFDRVAAQTELGFNLYSRLLNGLSIDFLGFNLISSALIIGAFGWFFYRNSLTPALSIALYGIFSFCIDVVQIRNSLAFVFVLIAINILLNHDNKRAKTIAAIAVFIGALFHFSALLFFVLFIKQRSRFKMLIVLLFISIALCVVLYYDNGIILYTLLSHLIGDVRATIMLTRFSGFSVRDVVKMYVIVTGTFAMSMLMLRVAQKANFTETSKQSSALKKNMLGRLEEMNFSVLCIMPLILISLDIYRIQRYMVPVTYVGFSVYYLPAVRRLVTKRVFTCFTILTVMVIFYLQIVSIGNLEGTFISVFMNNYFF